MTMSPADKAAAERELSKARAALSGSLDALDQRAHHVIHQVEEIPKIARQYAVPIGALAIVGSAAVVGGLVVHGAHRVAESRAEKRKLSSLLARALTLRPAEPSVWSGLGRAVLYGVAGVVAQHYAQQLLDRRRSTP